MLDQPRRTVSMGPKLLTEVKRQLTEDLLAYGLSESKLEIDLSYPCPEGHCTSALDGTLQSSSGVHVKDTNGEAVAEGWFDFIHGGDPNPLFVFWLFLWGESGKELHSVKKDRGIPKHVWDKLPEASKRICATEGTYDSRWSKDPLVQAWKTETAV